jgi:putative transposase
MTKVLVEGFSWVSIVVSLDWSTKKIVGHYAGMQGAARHWLAALDMAVNRQCPEGAEGKALALMSDHGCQPTSVAFMKACRTLVIHQAVTSDSNPQGNADPERVMRTLKAECLWFHEWTCPFALVSTLEAWIDEYHEHDLHSGLGYRTPRQFERDDDNSPSPPFLAA